MVPQKGLVSPTTDNVLAKRLKRKNSDALKAQKYANKNSGDFTCAATRISSAAPASSIFDISKENITIGNVRKTAKATRAKIVEIHEHEAEGQSVEQNNTISVSDPNWELPVCERRRLSAKPKKHHHHVTIM